MKKVRFKTWYWGNYCLAPNNMKLPEGFEEYNEQQHGWSNSEEWKERKREQYDDGCKPEHIKTFLDSTYYKNLIKRRQL